MQALKINALLNQIKNQPDIDKIYLYAKDLYDEKILIFNWQTWKSRLKSLWWS